MTFSGFFSFVGLTGATFFISFGLHNHIFYEWKYRIVLKIYYNFTTRGRSKGLTQQWPEAVLILQQASWGTIPVIK